MFEFNNLIKINPYSLNKSNKHNWYLQSQKQLCTFHYDRCREYAKISDVFFKKITKINKLENLPFVHASLFKDFNLVSVKNHEISRQLSSSGTKGKKSNIFLDKNTSLIQSRVLNQIFFDLLKEKLKIFFIDKKETLNTNIYSARSAAIKGFIQFVKKPEFILNDEMQLDINKIKNFVKNNPNEKFIIFGFTSLVYEKLLLEAEKSKKKYIFKNAILIHGGGWKKLENISISKYNFYKRIKERLGLHRIHNYYGMVEQVGSIFIECEEGNLHCSNYSEIIIRDKNMKVAKFGQKGLIQILSLLPLSYPGHNILTEDVGVILGEDDCKCSRKGKYFKVIGRVKDADLRGCSDAY